MSFKEGNKINQGRIPWNKGKKGLQKSKYKGKKMPWVGHSTPHSEETKAKISQTKKKNPTRYWLGKERSSEHAEKLRISRWGLNYVPKSYDGVRYRRIKEGSFKKEDWVFLKQIFQFTCVDCSKKEPEIKLTLDHIFPLSKGGLHEFGNIQPLCKSCNSRKRTKIIRTIYEPNPAWLTK